MKINKKNHHLQYVLLAIIALLLIIFTIAYLRTNTTTQPTEDDNINYNKPTSEQIKTGEEAKRSTIEHSEDKESTTSPQSSARKVLSAEITTAHVQNDTLYIRSNVSGVHSEGECTLTLSSQDRSLKKHAGLQPLPQSSTCKGFNIPVSELASGIWQIKLKIEIDKSSTTTTSEVEI